jgi:glycosyltransferase involved in cell wall biosynthesis
MKILQICQRPPHPPIDGGAIGMDNITQGMLELGHEVKVLTVATSKHPVQYDKISKDYIKKTGLEAVFIDTSIHVMDAFINLFESDSYNVKRFVSADFERKITEILGQHDYDIILLESLYVSPYIDLIRSFSNAKVVLRSPNVEYVIWERVADNSNNILKKSYLSLLAKRLKVYEQSVLDKLDGIASVTKEDLALFKEMGFKRKGIAVPTGIIIDKDLFVEIEQEEELSVFHIASMNWLPNVEAVDWFLKNVWNLVLLEVPQAKLYLAGRDMPDWLLKHKQKNVVVIGEVANARDFYRSKKIMVVPILSGGGMRVKIIEGMAIGKTIVSTTIGAEGIHCEHGKHILIANSPTDFAAAVIQCLEDEQLTTRLSNNAQQLIKEEFDNVAICKKIELFLKEL